MVPIGKASLAMYPEFIAEVQDLSGIATGYRSKGTVEALFSPHAREELNTIVALHRGLGLQAEASLCKRGARTGTGIKRRGRSGGASSRKKLR